VKVIPWGTDGGVVSAVAQALVAAVSVVRVEVLPAAS
jgi:hypothetical protein